MGNGIGSEFRFRTLFIVVTAFAFPMVIIVFSYSKLLQTVMVGIKFLSDLFLLFKSIRESVHVMTRQAGRSDMAMITLIGLLTSSYVWCWMPNAIFHIVRMFDLSQTTINCRKVEVKNHRVTNNRDVLAFRGFYSRCPG